MTIANGSPIIKADLDALITAQLALIQADNAQLPAGLMVNWTFPNLVASTNATRAKAYFVAPWDLYVESLGADTVDHTAASTFKAALYGDGNLLNYPRPASVGGVVPFISVSVANGAGFTKGGRLIRDNTKGPAKADAATAQSFTVIPRGTTITLVVTTTSIAAPSEAHVTAVFRQFWGRE